MKKIIFILSTFFLISGCGPQYVADPNANVLVTSQYEDGPVVIHLSPNSKPQADCKNKSEIQCAEILYTLAEDYMVSAESLATKKLYLSASLEYMLALTHFTEAEIRINRIKKWSATEAKLRQRVKYQIKICKIKINSYHNHEDKH